MRGLLAKSRGLRRTFAGSLAGGGGDPFGDDLVLLLNFDGTTGMQDVADEGPFSLPLVWNGNAVLGTTRVYNASYETSMNLDGTGDFVSISGWDDVWQPGTGPYTVEFRAYSTHPGGNQDYLFGSGDDAGNQYSQQFVVDDTSGGLLRYETQQNNVEGTRIQLTGRADYRNAWHEWAITFDGTTIFMYEDGVVIGSNAPVSKLLSVDPTSSLRIGGRVDGGGGDPFQGQIQACRWTLADRYGGVGYTPDAGKWVP